MSPCPSGEDAVADVAADADAGTAAPRIRRGFVDGPHGQLHYREVGTGPVIVLVHQILRTSLDYRLVMLHLSRRHRVIAFDAPGCGDSEAPAHALGLGDHAVALGAGLDALGVDDALVAGHHSGANVALELALTRPTLVRAVVLSGLFHVEDADLRAELLGKALALHDPPPRADGSHLLALWNEGLRTNWGKPRLPADRLDLLGEFFLEQYLGGPRRFEPYVAQMRYDTAARLPALRCPCLFVAASGDVWMCRATDAWRRDQPTAQLEEIVVPEGGELPRLHPRAWAETILRFAARTAREEGR